ncbi:hypothetical protein [Sporosarcina sp. HYO08]|uniref:hypothetical protein n=1 Tax=Sporosarcina sp. HYO08 TaxID=1759557 RepID=UPI0007926DED|nr:hypothetical protein [Sporosarcina sp. HYO08]KXH86897.1 hypothetical protein AU377_13775 [Sporosarcina sp. HYO08]
MDWSQLLIGVLPLIGVIIGSAATFITQSHKLKKQIKREIEKEKDERNIERLSIYSDIIKLDGENLMQEHIDGSTINFNLQAFSEKFRPVFFSRFYLIDQEVADKIRLMDYIIAESIFYEELLPDREKELIVLFNQMIIEIELHLRNYRHNMTGRKTVI